MEIRVFPFYIELFSAMRPRPWLLLCVSLHGVAASVHLFILRGPAKKKTMSRPRIVSLWRACQGWSSAQPLTYHKQRGRARGNAGTSEQHATRGAARGVRAERRESAERGSFFIFALSSLDISVKPPTPTQESVSACLRPCRLADATRTGPRQPTRFAASEDGRA